MMSKHLANLQSMRIAKCEKCETLKPLAKFRNLEYVSFDFHPPRDELTFIYENSRTLESVRILGRDVIRLLSTATGPKLHRCTFIRRRPDGIILKMKEFESDTQRGMVAHSFEKGLFEKL